MNDLKKSDILFNAFIACGEKAEKTNVKNRTYVIASDIVYMFDENDKYLGPFIRGNADLGIINI